MKQRVLVTGGTGFIGSHLVEALVARGEQVTVLCRHVPMAQRKLERVWSCINVCKADLVTGLHDHTVDLNHFDTVFHLAGSASIIESVNSPQIDYAQNLEATFCLLETIRKATSPPKLIFCSSAAVYGNPPRMPIGEADPTLPVSPYGVSKLTAERYLAVYSQLFGLKTTSLRLFSVFGPRQEKQVIYDFMCKLQKDSRILTIRGDGNQERDFIYIDNAVNAILTVADKAPMRGEAYNVASGKSTKIRELAQAICKVAGTKTTLVCSGEADRGQPYKWSVDIAKLKSLGFTPTVDLEEGIWQTYQWFQLCHEAYSEFQDKEKQK